MRAERDKIIAQSWALLNGAGSVHFQMQNFAASYVIFAKLSNDIPESHDDRPLFLHNAVASAARIGKWKEAYHYGKIFLDAYPEHELMPAVARVLVEIIFLRGEYEEAYEISGDVRTDMETGSEIRDIPDFVLRCLGLSPRENRGSRDRTRRVSQELSRGPAARTGSVLCRSRQGPALQVGGSRRNPQRLHPDLPRIGNDSGRAASMRPLRIHDRPVRTVPRQDSADHFRVPQAPGHRQDLEPEGRCLCHRGTCLSKKLSPAISTGKNWPGN